MRESIQCFGTIVNRTDTCDNRSSGMDNRSSGMRQSIQCYSDEKTIHYKVGSVQKDWSQKNRNECSGINKLLLTYRNTWLGVGGSAGLPGWKTRFNSATDRVSAGYPAFIILDSLL